VSALLEVTSISVSFDGFKAINNLSFEIGGQELRAIIGPNGAGKTTFMDIVTGKTRPDEGHRAVGRTPARSAQAVGKPDRAGRRRPQVSAPTVFEDAERARQPDDGAEAMTARPFAVLRYRRAGKMARRVSELAEEIGLSGELERTAGELSHGQKQWLEIGMLLAQDPKLLLVDEPAAGMTLGERNTRPTCCGGRRNPCASSSSSMTWNSSAGSIAR
jgi:urea transport system ATP-binding protein